MDYYQLKISCYLVETASMRQRTPFAFYLLYMVQHKEKSATGQIICQCAFSFVNKISESFESETV